MRETGEDLRGEILNLKYKIESLEDINISNI